MQLLLCDIQSRNTAPQGLPPSFRLQSLGNGVHPRCFIGLVCLGVVWSFYFNDFLNICRSTEKRHLDIVLNVFFWLLGWKVLRNKLVPHDTCIQHLLQGAWNLDLGQALKGYVLLKNTDRRRHELVFELERALQANSLAKAGNVCKGECSLPAASCMGVWLVRLCMLSLRVGRKAMGWGKLTWAIKHLLALLKCRGAWPTRGLCSWMPASNRVITADRWVGL